LSTASRLFAAFAALVVVAAGAAAAPAGRSLAGRLLVATDAMNDSRFERAVIYLVRHDASGAFGLVINLPRGDVPYERALRPLGLETPPGSGSVRVYWGGSVSERRGFVLHTPEWRGEGTEVVGGGFALTEDPRVLFCLGYAIAVADERLVFEEDPPQKWIEAMSRRLLDL
jgi:putative AlgH/UPF0301 family transcriptional regulator